MAMFEGVLARVLHKSINPFTQSRKNVLHHGIRSMSTPDTFKANDVEIHFCPPSQMKQKPPSQDLVFGKTYSDHMLEIQWDGDKWGKPIISPFHYLQMHPAAKSLHYGVQLFEGMKAYRGVDEVIRLYRPEMNMARMNATANRGALPTFDGDELLTLIKKLVQIDQEWVPYTEASSLYIRPTLISNEEELKVEQPKKALLYVILSPTGPYFSSGFEPISLLADPQYVRAWPGGVGAFKLGANYGPTLAIQKVAMSKGFHQVLWLYGPDHHITEMGAMNIFIFIQKKDGGKELVTPPLDGLILPGVTRKSVLELAEQWGEFEVNERPITMKELIEVNNEGRLLEVFGVGTAIVVCPVGEIHFEKNVVNIPTASQKSPLYQRFYDAILNIQYGKTASPWAVPIQ